MTTTITYIEVFKQSSTYVQRLFHADGKKKERKEIDAFKRECEFDNDDLGPDPARSWFEESPEIKLDEQHGEDTGKSYNNENIEYNEDDEQECLIDGDLAPCPAKLWFKKLRGEIDNDDETNEKEQDDDNEEKVCIYPYWFQYEVLTIVFRRRMEIAKPQMTKITVSSRKRKMEAKLEMMNLKVRSSTQRKTKKSA